MENHVADLHRSAGWRQYPCFRQSLRSQYLEPTKGILLQPPVPGIDKIPRLGFTTEHLLSSGESFWQKVLIEPRLIVAGHQMIKLIEVGHQPTIARNKVLEAPAFQMRPNRTMEQNITAEQDSVSSIQKAYVIRSFPRRVDHLQFLVAQIEPFAMVKPMAHRKRRNRGIVRIKSVRPGFDHQIVSQNFGR